MFGVVRCLPRALADRTGCALAAVGVPLTPAAAPGVAGPPPPPPPLPPPLGRLEPESKPRLLTLTTSVLSELPLPPPLGLLEPESKPHSLELITLRSSRPFADWTAVRCAVALSCTLSCFVVTRE